MSFGHALEPSDDEQDDFIDELLGEDEDDSSDEFADDDDDSTDERDDASPSDDDEDDADADDADDDGLDAVDTLAAETPTLPPEVQQQILAVAHAAQAEREARLQTERAYDVLGRLQTIRQQYLERGDEQGWNEFQQRLGHGYKDHMLQQSLGALRQIGEQVRQGRLQEGEQQAHQAAIEHYEPKFHGFSNTERLTLWMAQTPDQFMQALETIRSDRRAQTEPARRALRQQRAASRADTAGARTRGSGADRGSSKQDYNNYTDLDAYIDDVMSA